MFYIFNFLRERIFLVLALSARSPSHQICCSRIKVALIELGFAPSQKSSATPGAGVSLCHFPYLVLCLLFACLFICLYLGSAFHPLTVVSLGLLLPVKHFRIWDRKYCKNIFFSSFFPTINRKSKLVPNSKDTRCTSTSNCRVPVSKAAFSLVL